MVEVVNDVFYLCCFLLLEGEFGCGKICFVYFIVYELGYFLKECYICFMSWVEELFYIYDNICCLYDF